MSLSALYSLPQVDEKLAHLDAEIELLQARLDDSGRDPRIEAVLVAARQRRLWYVKRQEYLRSRQQGRPE